MRERAGGLSLSGPAREAAQRGPCQVSGMLHVAGEGGLGLVLVHAPERDEHPRRGVAALGLPIGPAPSAAASDRVSTATVWSPLGSDLYTPRPRRCPSACGDGQCEQCRHSADARLSRTSRNAPPWRCDATGQIRGGSRVSVIEARLPAMVEAVWPVPRPCGIRRPVRDRGHV